MLQQILKDMWVDPAILAELDDDQKQTLFCRMREEQVRRWRLWDQKLSEQPPPPPRRSSAGKKSVQFKNGEDGEPWVWVMGEHPDDLSIEQILEQEAREKARKQAELEAHQLRRSVEEELTGLLDLNQKQILELEAASPGTGTGPGGGSPPAPPPPPKLPPEDDPAEMIYCSVDELREWTSNKNNCANNNVVKNNNINNAGHGFGNGMNGLRNGLNGSSNKIAWPVPDKRDVLQEISLNNKALPRVAQRVAQWERRVLETRTEQILCSLKKRQLEAAREAEEMAPHQEKLWQEQERRAKEAEQQIREIARRAREEHRRTSVLDEHPAPGTEPPAAPAPAAAVAAPLPPQSRDAVVRWYREKEEPRRAGLDANGVQQPWFHGLISRQDAESRLSSRGAGAFLVRLSERVWGYAISYRDTDRCKHYLVDTASGGYQFLGANQLCHKTLEDLVSYHREQPITQVGGERLLEPCIASVPVPAPARAPAPAPAPAPAHTHTSPPPPPAASKPPLPALPARPIHSRPLPPLPHLRTVCARGD